METGEKKERGGCHGCVIRTPYATLVAVSMCWVGSGVFCGTMYRGVNLTLRLLQDVFRLDRGLQWVEPTQLTFLIVGASMGALSLMILVLAVLATGDTRVEVYKSPSGRAGGQIATGCFIFITYVLLVAWLLIFICCVVMTTFYTLSWGVCSTDEIAWENGGIDFYPLHFMFPEGTQKVNMLVEGQAEIKMFCKDYVQRAEVMFILSTVACFIVVLSLVHFLMSLSANYAHIRGHHKFTDLKDLYTVDFTSDLIANSQRNPNSVL